MSGTIIFLVLALPILSRHRRPIALQEAKRLLIPALAFVAVFSCLGHKELRFIIYVLPLLNIVAALVVSAIVEDAEGSAVKTDNKSVKSSWSWLSAIRWGDLFVFLCISSTVATTVAFSVISHYNYPGGNALLHLHQHHQVQKSKAQNLPCHVSVYIDVAAAMTGISRFSEALSTKESDLCTFVYDKREDITVGSQVFDDLSFDYVITDNTNLLTNDGYELMHKEEGVAAVVQRWLDGIFPRSLISRLFPTASPPIIVYKRRTEKSAEKE